MSEVGGLCCGCLVSGRRVFQLSGSELQHVYAQLTDASCLTDLGAWDVVCWECRAMLLRVDGFRRQVQFSYMLLQQHLLEDPSLSNVGSIVRSPQLQSHKAYSHSYPELECVKTESDYAETKLEFVKAEPDEYVGDQFDDDNNYSEPEQFANGLEEAPVEKVKKKKKGKKEKKKKRKKKKCVADDVSSDGLTDLESVIDYYNDVPTVSEVKVLEKPKVKKDKEFDPREIKLITLTHEEMLKEREKEAAADYFVKCPHQCKDCILGFKYERTLQTHIETKHGESAGEHVCPVCLVRFQSSAQHREHARRHLQRYKCTVCGKKCLTLLPMLKHVRNHKEYKCQLCGLTSGSLFRHQTHMAKEHHEKPQCVECGKMFSSRKTYRYHINVIHKGQNRFPCPHCGKIYQWKSNLWRHIKNHKARDNGELHCVPCNKKFSSIATYQQHLKISRKHVTEDEFHYTCDECGKKFANKTRLRDHVDWDHLKKINYRCQICNKVKIGSPRRLLRHKCVCRQPFKSNTSLYVHMQNVHRNKEEKDNLCHVCGKSYQNIAKLKYHIVAMHTTETPYTCEQCPSAFSWYSSLYRHIKEVHEKVKLKKKRPRRKEAAPSAASPSRLPPHATLPTPPPHMLSAPRL